MQILVCAATVFEIEPTTNWIAKNENKNIETLVTGVGLTAATYALSKSIFTKRPDLVILAGVAGGLDETIELSKCLVIEDESIGDLGVTENGTFKTVFDLGFEEKNEPPWIDGKLKNSYSNYLQLTGLPIANGVTVNEISTNKARINYYKNSLKAKVESMEGAALHYICLKEKIPFLQIRSISNFIGERDKTKWQLNNAILNVTNELITVLRKLIEL